MILALRDEDKKESVASTLLPKNFHVSVFTWKVVVSCTCLTSATLKYDVFTMLLHRNKQTVDGVIEVLFVSLLLRQKRKGRRGKGFAVSYLFLCQS